MNFGGTLSSWPSTVDLCLRSTGSGNYIACESPLIGEKTAQAYRGQPFVQFLDCASTEDPEVWDGTGPAPSLAVSLFEATGGSASLTWERSQLGGAITFTSANRAWKTEPLDINQRVSIVDGVFQVKFSAIVAGGGQTEVDNGFACTLSGYY